MSRFWACDHCGEEVEPWMGDSLTCEKCMAWGHEWKQSVDNEDLFFCDKCAEKKLVQTLDDENGKGDFSGNA